MIKSTYYCDQCEKEIGKYDANKITLEKFKIMRNGESQTNLKDFDFCSFKCFSEWTKRQNEI